jgi:protein involved in ribonucleotide reduction
LTHTEINSIIVITTDYLGGGIMKIYFASRTGNVKRFIESTGFDAEAIGDVVVSEPFVLVTYTDLFGQVPKVVDDFLDLHHENLIGVSGSGNKNWGADLFARSADLISKKYGVPIISKFEMSGTKGDVEVFKERVLQLCQDGLSLTMK